MIIQQEELHMHFVPGNTGFLGCSRYVGGARIRRLLSWVPFFPHETYYSRNGLLFVREKTSTVYLSEDKPI